MSERCPCTACLTASLTACLPLVLRGAVQRLCRASLSPPLLPLLPGHVRRLAEALLEECIAHLVAALVSFLRSVTEADVVAIRRDDAKVRTLFARHTKPDKVGRSGAAEAVRPMGVFSPPRSTDAYAVFHGCRWRASASR